MAGQCVCPGLPDSCSFPRSCSPGTGGRCSEQSLTQARRRPIRPQLSTTSTPRDEGYQTEEMVARPRAQDHTMPRRQWSGSGQLLLLVHRGGKKQRPRPDSSVKVARVAREEEEEEERNGCAKHPQREKRQDGRRRIGLLTTSWRAQGRVAGHESAEGEDGRKSTGGSWREGPGRRREEDRTGRDGRTRERERERVTGEEQRSDVETGGLASERLDGGKE